MSPFGTGEVPLIRLVYEAIVADNLPELKRLLDDHPAMLHYSDASMVSLLWPIAHSGHVDLAEHVIDRGVDVNKATSYGGTALEVAVGGSRGGAPVEFIRYLLSRGADPNLGRPMIGAINREPPEESLAIVKLLIEHGADVNRAYDWFGKPDVTFTALEWASSKPAIAAFLRAHGAVDRPKPTRPADPTADVVSHFARHFGPPEDQSLVEVVPSTDPPVRIHRIPPRGDRTHLTLFTTGMSTRAMTVPDGGDDFRYAELFIDLPGDWPMTTAALADPRHRWPVDWLRSAAGYPHAHGTWLGGPATIIANGDPPEPLGPGVGFTALLLLAERELTAADGRLIRLYRLTPLHPAEYALERADGLPALLRAFDRVGVPFVVDPSRPSVAGG